MKQPQSILINGQPVSLQPANANIRNITAEHADQSALKSVDDPFVICDVGRLLHQHLKWFEHLPRVMPFYAVKCNNDPVLLSTLANMGLGFDCASKGEISAIMDLGVAAERIIFANPCKPRSHLRYACQQGVDLMTFDNDQELYKVKEINPAARLILRIAVSDPTAVCQLNLKFGCDPKEKAPSLLKLAALLELNVVGISFHVGSGCRDPSAFGEAIAHADRLFDIGREHGHDMQILDLGGGYPGVDSDEISFKQITDVINAALDTHFPVGRGTRIIAEPGRYYATSTTMVCCNVIAKSEISADQITKDPQDVDKPGFMYYLNDGVYGSFNCILYDHVTPVSQPLRQDLVSAKKHMTSVWGPTCDSMDCIYSESMLPEYDIGDWMAFDNMGAYTVSAYSDFNGFEKPETFYYVGQDDWDILQRYFAASSVRDDVEVIAVPTADEAESDFESDAVFAKQPPVIREMRAFVDDTASSSFVDDGSEF